MKKQYTVKQVMDLTGYSERSIRAFIKDGKIKVVRTFTNRLRIPEDELKKIVKEK